MELKTKISVVIQCKGRKDHVLRSIENLRNDLPNIIVVDYNCPDRTAALVSREYPEIVCVKESTEAYYNASKARNLGLGKVKTPLVFFKDADILPSPSFVRRINSIDFEREFVLMGSKRAFGANGSVVTSTSAARKIGGYDEFFYGYGQQDIDFFERLKMIGLEPRYITGEPQEILSHSVTQRTQYHPYPRNEALVRNRIYGYIKRDLMSLGRRYFMRASERKILRDKCDTAFDSALKAKKPAVRISIAPSFSEAEYFSTEHGGAGFHGRKHINRKLTYTFVLGSHN
jgi:glycosyltransferase involved in cell wall biosynthesis